jgi:hypothetical protein
MPSSLGNSDHQPATCGPLRRVRAPSRSRAHFSRPVLLAPAVISLLATLALPGLAVQFLTLPAQSKVASEYEIKAAFLYNFAKFVEWPAGVFSDPKQPMGICVFGQDPFGHALEDALLGKTVGDHTVMLGHARQLADLAGCQIAFLSSSDGVRLKEILVRVRSQHVLIVGESEGFAAAGGAIQFVLDQNRVRFVINPDAAERAGLKINSKLLALATIVHDSPRPSESRN